MLFAFGIGYGIGIMAGWKCLWYQIAFPAVLIFFLYQLLKKKKEMRMIFGITMLSFLFVVFIGICKKSKYFSYWREGYDYLCRWKFFETMDVKYAWPVIVILQIVLFAVFLWMKKVPFGNEVLTSFSLLFLLWQIFYGYEWEKIPVLAMLFVILSGSMKTWKKYRLKQDEREEKSTYVILLLLLCFIACLPIQKEPLSLRPVLNQITAAGEWIERHFFSLVMSGDKKEFNTQIAGFPDEKKNFFGKLGEGVEWEMLDLSGNIEKSHAENYFTGTIKEYYEKESWSSYANESLSGTKQYTEQEWTFLEHLYYLQQADIAQVDGEEFCSQNRYCFTYQELESSTIFYPSNCYLLLPQDRKEPILEEEKRLCFEKPQKKGNSYQAYGLATNMEQENLIAYLRGEKQKSIEGEDCFTACVNEIGLAEETLDKITDESFASLLEERKEEILERDLQLPENLESELTELAEEIVKDAGNDYDRAVAIRDYLEENYTYHKAVQTPPEGVDAVSYFLFDSKEGYCTYFASAMTLLCRAADIPARYVEGIYCNYETKEDGSYRILGSDAHAWTEVYIENFGFIILDATPGYRTTGTNWETQKSNSVVQPQMAQNLSKQQKPVEREEKPVTEQRNVWKHRIVTVAGSCAAFILCLSVLLFAQKISYLHLTKEERAKICMSRILKKAQRRGIGIEKNETLRQYTERIRMRLKNPDAWEEVVEIYENMYYGEEKITTAQLRCLEQYKYEITGEKS